MQETDSVSWEDNVLEFTDGNGDDWRFERDQEAATEFSVARNDTTVGTLDIEWDGSNVESITMTAPEQSYWVTIDTTGTIIDAYGGGPPQQCGTGGPCVEFVLSDCDEEWDDTLDAGNDTIAAGLVAIATQGMPLIGVGAAGYFGIKVADWGGSVLSLGMCLVT